MSNELISIIVPIYNVEKYLKKCLDSIVCQTYQNIEIVLIDDGSTDNSGIICDEYASNDRRVKTIHRKNAGLVSARKEGLLISTGVFTAYVDGDDWIEENWIENLYRFMDNSKADVVCAAHFLDYESEICVASNYIPEGVYDSKDILGQSLFCEPFYTFGITQYVWSKLYKKKSLLKVQNDIPDGITIGEDVALTYNVLANTEKICITNNAGYHYIQRNDSMSSVGGCFEVQKCEQLIDYLKKSLLNNKHGFDFSKQITQYEKLLFLVRHLEKYDKGSIVLEPFGGIPINSEVVIYGAGAIGKSIALYLESKCILRGWLDRSYKRLSNILPKVSNPEEFDYFKYKNCRYIIAISNMNTVDSIKKYLLEKGLCEENLYYLSESFINYYS